MMQARMRQACLLAAVVGIVAAAAQVGFTQTRTSAATPIEGVWKGTSVVVTGANASTNPNRKPNIIIYTKNHYSIVTQDGRVPLPARKAVAPPKDPNKLTDAEKIARYDLWAPVNAESGTYDVKGTVLTYHPAVDKGIPVDTGAPLELRFEGNNTMVTIAKSAPGAPVSEIRRTFTRLE